MKKFIIYSGIVLGIMLSVFSCKKNDDHTNEATITIAKPLAGAMYDQGDTVYIQATITAAEAMHGWEVNLTNESNASLFSADVHDHAATYNIDTFWVNTIAVTNHVKVEVKAEIDHDGNTASKTVEIHCMQ